jgi:hypothetical protein
MIQHEWEHVTDSTFVRCRFESSEVIDEEAKAWTERLRVPGGWLYRVTIGVDEGAPSVTLCFVPEP